MSPPSGSSSWRQTVNHTRSHSDPVSPTSEHPPNHNSTNGNGTTHHTTNGVNDESYHHSTSSSQQGSDLYAPTPMTLTIESLARLGLSNGTEHRSSHENTAGTVSGSRRDGGGNLAVTTTSRNRWPFMNPANGGLGSGSAQMQMSGSTQSPLGRMFSATPSVTSVSDDEDGDQDRAIVQVDEEAKEWLDKKRRESMSRVREHKGKGKGKMRLDEGEGDGSGIAGSLPPEILIHIFRLLHNPRDLVSSLLVSRSWCLCAFSLLWYKPTFTETHTLASIIRVLSSHNPTSLPYAHAIRRLHLSSVAEQLTDELILPLADCSRVERLTLTAANRLSANALVEVIGAMPELSAVDVSEIDSVNDEVVMVMAKRCRKLQAVNLSNCKLVGDQGVLAMAEYDKLLKRVKLVGCHRVTERSLIPLVRSCTLILELDLQDVIAVTDSTVHSIFLHLAYLRELRLNGCVELTEDCIPNLATLIEMSDDELVLAAREVGLYHSATGSHNLNLDLPLLRPSAATFEFLRTVDLTGCTNLRDKAIENLIFNAPKLRTLSLTKCVNLTDKCLESVGRLGKHLHHLHLGHVKLITDEAVIRLARSCTRLRYIDLACCDLLTDRSVFELGSNMPKLRRVGLVKVTNITDDAIYALVERHTSLERVHLSYCDKLSVKAVTFLLNRLRELKHLSLTGVPAFRVKELQQFCREPPKNFNQHQRSAFCVYSGDNVTKLRNYLNEHLLAAGLESDNSTRRDSASSTSSITIPGGPSPPPFIPAQGQPVSSSSPSLIYRRGSVPILRSDRDREAQVPGLPTAAFTTATPNFLSPTLSSLPPSSPLTRSSGGGGGGGRTMPGGYRPSIPSRVREESGGISSRSSSSSLTDDIRRGQQPVSTATATASRDRPNGPRGPMAGLGISAGEGDLYDRGGSRRRGSVDVYSDKAGTERLW
ncbi:hypothetical protein CI109_107363 [Kwoniella shandongensis]|uniref:F-box domain-containing protein n=1 Tax=Kwoniella shandongensis TaxID=1734106 RepID=A0AAJ8N0T1_9TREE